MSFPFVVPLNDTPQPTPTGGPLSIIERANQTAPYAGGGGGPIGPNPVVSSITLGGQFPNVNMADGGLLITNNGFDTTSTIVGIEYNPTAPSGGGIGGLDFTTIQAGTLNTYPVLDLALGGDGRMLLTLNSTMSIVGDSVNISSLNVSSINGAAPGGGSVPANLSVSTLNVAGLASVSSLTGVAGAPLTLDGQGQAINVAATALNVPAAPTTISTLLVSSINGAAPGALPNSLSLSTLAVSSINNFAYQTSAVGTNFVNTLGSGINTSNSVIYTNGKFQVVQFDVGVSTILYGGAGPTQFKIPMVSNEISPGNWFWANNFTPMMTMVGLAAGENYVGGVETLNLQMSGTNPQTLQVWGNFTDSNYQPNYRITLTGIAP